MGYGETFTMSWEGIRVRKILGPLLLGLGAFLLVAAVMAVTWAPGVAKRTPIDVDKTTNLEGQAAKLDVESGELVENPIYVLSITQTDTDASTDDTVVWVSKTCVVVDEGQDPRVCLDGKDPLLISASIDVFATDRVSAIAVNDAKGLPEDAVPHEGLVNKWPFDSEKKTYPYWDGLVGGTVDAVYDRSEVVEGLDTYVYRVEINDAEIEIAEGVPGTYDDVKEIWVEPRTGAIVNQSDDQQRYLEDGTQVLDLQIEFTEEQVKNDVADTEDNLSTLNLITKIVPLVGFIGGGVCLLAGIFFLLRGRKSRATAEESPQLAGASR